MSADEQMTEWLGCDWGSGKERHVYVVVALHSNMQMRRRIRKKRGEGRKPDWREVAEIPQKIRKKKKENVKTEHLK